MTLLYSGVGRSWPGSCGESLTASAYRGRKACIFEISVLDSLSKPIDFGSNDAMPLFVWVLSWIVRGSEAPPSYIWNGLPNFIHIGRHLWERRPKTRFWPITEDGHADGPWPSKRLHKCCNKVDTYSSDNSRPIISYGSHFTGHRFF